ncbi:MAG: helix-turn-helix transcriptional regulator [Clostridia bacterium]|nr:helix-turn-helix transcriptional regulator [Clostridia bacterium]
MIQKRLINWEKTGKMLRLLRCDNINLRRNVCKELSMQLKKGHICKATNCDNCILELDNQISQAELAEVMGVSDSVITNWENGRSIPTLEDLLLYADLCKMDLQQILIFEN